MEQTPPRADREGNGDAATIAGEVICCWLWFGSLIPHRDRFYGAAIGAFVDSGRRTAPFYRLATRANLHRSHKVDFACGVLTIGPGRLQTHLTAHLSSACHLAGHAVGVLD